MVRARSPLGAKRRSVRTADKSQDRITGVMSTPTERNWTAHVVLSCEHAGLRPYFKELEAELYHVLARVDDPRMVKDYLQVLRERSKAWASAFIDHPWKK